MPKYVKSDAETALSGSINSDRGSGNRKSSAVDGVHSLKSLHIWL